MSGAKSARERMMRGHDRSRSQKLGRVSRSTFLLVLVVLALVALLRSADSRYAVAALSKAPAAYPPGARAELMTREAPPPRQTDSFVVKPPPRGPDLSLESSFAQLAADADAGDRFASCQLSRALALCEEAQSLRNDEQFWTGVAVRTKSGSAEENFAIARISKNAESLASAAVLCIGLSPDRLNEAAMRMLQAAELGDPRAMAHFALYSRAPSNQSGARMDYDRKYREQAVAMLERSASSGNLRAMRSLYEVYLHGLSPNRDESMRVEKDPASALAIGTALLQKVAPREKEYITATMALIENRATIMSSQRYLTLLMKYSAYMDEISMRGFDDTGSNTDVAGCRDYR